MPDGRQRGLKGNWYGRPNATPAHGTAYDIAGKGLANVGAMKNAFELACKMAQPVIPA